MVRFLGRIAIVMAALQMSASASAAERIRICNDEKPHPPFVYPDRDGTVQVLLHMAAARIGVELNIYQAPMRRCRADMLQGLADAVPLAVYNPQLNRQFAFPMRDGAADPAKVSATSDILVFRRKGSPSSWDGARFHNLTGPVLVPSGHGYLTHRLESTRIAYDDGARDAEQNFMKIMGGRADLTILPANDGVDALQDPRWADKIEMLSAPYLVQEFYTAFSPHYFQAHPDVAAGLWQAIADVKNSREYKLAISRLR